MADCPPRFATPRTPERKTLGGRVARIAEALGLPLMPWQRLVADVALELTPEGRLVHREVVVLTPRQSGKTTLELAVMLARALGEPGTHIRYTAQSGVAARQKVVDEWVPALQRSPFAEMFRPRLTNGHEAIRFHNGSRIELVSSTRTSGHGLTLDHCVIDEAFAQTDARLEQSLKPTMITRPSPQLWIVSTAGTPETSAYLWGKVETGRQLAGVGVDSACFFEWSAPEDADISDRDVWRRTMPALGHTITETAIEADFHSMAAGEFARAYLCQWRAPARDPIVPLERWRALADVESESPRPQVLAIDVSPDGGSAAIAAAARIAGGRVHVGILEHGPGTGWVAPRAAELFRELLPRQVLLDARSPAASLEPDLIEAGVRRIVKTTATQMTDACQQFVNAANERRIVHRGTAELIAAIDGAAKRPLLDAWALKRRGSSSDISPLVGVILAHFACRQPRGDVLHVFTPGELMEGDDDDLPGELLDG
jgi:Terminase large subunit, T4likevirus-type, N-terminal